MRWFSLRDLVHACALLQQIYPSHSFQYALVPLLDIILNNLSQCGVDSIAVNTHYCAEKVKQYLETSAFQYQVTLFHENEILDTGGPIVNALSVLKESDCFILHNGDILTDIDFGQLVDQHKRSRAIATMVVIDGDEKRVRVSPR